MKLTVLLRQREVQWVAAMIASIRVAALWLGRAGTSRPDWAQIPGYFLLMLTLPEAFLVRNLRFEPFRWAIVLSVILAATSFFWAAFLVWLIKPEPKE